MNAWLRDNPGVQIVHVRRASNGGRFDTSKVFLSVWYEEGPYLFGPAAPPSAAAVPPASQGLSRPPSPQG